MPISFIPYTSLYGPLSIGASCTLWLDAADTTTLQLSGSSVVQWNDKSGNMRNASGGVSPTYSPASNAIVFNGTSSYLTVPAATYAPLTAAFCVINYTGTTEGTVYRRGLTTGNTFEFGLSILNTTQIRTSIVLSGTSREFTVGTSTTQQTMFCSTWDSSMYSLLKNGNTLTSGTQSGTESTSSQPIAIGQILNDIGQPLNIAYFTGNIYEIIFFNSVLSTTQRQAIEGYLAQKWGLTANLPPNHPALSKTFYNGRVYQPQISLKPAPYANYFPLSVAGCALWLDAADPYGTGTAPANGATLSTWSDKSLNNLSLTTVGTPTYNSTQYGKGGVIFNGSSYFQNTIFSFPLATRAIFIVGNGSSVNTGLLALANVVDYNNINSLVYTTNGSKSVYLTEYYPSGFNAIFTSPVEPVLISDSADGSSVSFYGNGSLVQSLSFSPTASTGIFVGARNDNASDRKPMTGNINEIILYKITLTTNQRQQIEGYLAWKWGLQSSLPVTHPYYSAAPLQYTRGAILGAPTLTATGSASYANTAYYNVSPQAWNYNWRPYLQSLVAANSQANATASTIPVASQGHWGGVLASNACIYCAPTQNTNVLVINTLTNTTINLAVGVSGYQGGVLAPDGKIYFIPAGSPTSVLVVNPTDNSFTTFTGTASYTGGWVGGTLASNGLIYCSPLNAVNVLVIDPINRTTSNLVGAATYPASGNYSWQCAVLAPNGLIYMPPTGATTTLVVDPLMNTTSNMAFTAGSAYQANGWIGGVLHPNGKIYCTPYSATSVLIIDPIAGTTNTTALALAASASPGVAAYTTPAGWSGATLGPNGKIYCSPHLATSFLVIDPTAGTTSNLAVTNNTSPGAILAPNGNIYAIPRGSASTTLMLTFSTLAQSPNSNYCLSAWTNRF